MSERSLRFLTRQHIPSLKMTESSVVTRKYENQVGGRADIVKLFEDHILKPTTIHEVTNYLNMPSTISRIGPDVCAIITNGKLIPLKQCKCCENIKHSSALLNISSGSPHSIIMRDAAYGMSRPRVLDLKMGFRTYSDHVPEEKKRSHTKRSQGTTSSSLFMRVCGASYYHDNKKTLISKMQGRAMTAEDLITFMKTFFDLGKEQKKLLISQLKTVKFALENTDAHRFFGSSLLIIVDDDTKNKTLENTVTTKLIDFSSMARSEEGSPQYYGPDTAAIWGVSNLIDILES